MLIKHFETNLYTYLGTFFSEHGYDLLPNKKQFRKVTQNGFTNVIFSVSEASTDLFWVDVHFGIRNNAVEQIAQQFLNNSVDFRNDANTLVINIGKFNDLKYFRFKIENNDDLEEMAIQICDFFLLTGFNFMEKTASISEIEKLLNHKPIKANKYLYNQVHRAYKGIIAAKLTNKQHFTPLINTYRNYVVKVGTEQEMINYERLVGFLLYYSPN